MDELTFEDLKQLVIFYNKRCNESETKNVELQLIINRLKISYESKITDLGIEIEKLYKRLEAAIIAQPIEKTIKPAVISKPAKKATKVKASK